MGPEALCGEASNKNCFVHFITSLLGREYHMWQFALDCITMTVASLAQQIVTGLTGRTAAPVCNQIQKDLPVLIMGFYLGLYINEGCIPSISMVKLVLSHKQDSSSSLPSPPPSFASSARCSSIWCAGYCMAFCLDHSGRTAAQRSCDFAGILRALIDVLLSC